MWEEEARIILDKFNGIGVYRNGFRIRPLGDAGFDWLLLDKQRVQNPSLKVGSDQVMDLYILNLKINHKLVKRVQEMD